MRRFISERCLEKPKYVCLNKEPNLWTDRELMLEAQIKELEHEIQMLRIKRPRWKSDWPSESKEQMLALQRQRLRWQRWKWLQDDLRDRALRGSDLVSGLPLLRGWVPIPRDPSTNVSQGDNDAGHKVTRWALPAQSFTKAEVQKATEEFKISHNSKTIMRVLEKYSTVSLRPQSSCHVSERLFLFE